MLDTLLLSQIWVTRMIGTQHYSLDELRELLERLSALQTIVVRAEDLRAYILVSFGEYPPQLHRPNLLCSHLTTLHVYCPTSLDF